MGKSKLVSAEITLLLHFLRQQAKVSSTAMDWNDLLRFLTSQMPTKVNTQTLIAKDCTRSYVAVRRRADTSLVHADLPRSSR